MSEVSDDSWYEGSVEWNDNAEWSADSWHESWAWGESEWNTDAESPNLSSMFLSSFENAELNVWVGERDDPTSRSITFRVDSGADKTVVPPSHPAVRGYRLHHDGRTGAAYSTAGKETIYDEGRRVLVGQDQTGQPGPILVDSRQAKCRRPLMAVSEMNKRGNWVCFGPERQGFAFNPKTGRRIDFKPTGGGWDVTLNLEVPNHANKVVQQSLRETKSKRELAEASQQSVAGLEQEAQQQNPHGSLIKILGCNPFDRRGM